MEKHQYGFAVLNGCTGGCRRKSFWGRGSTEEECRHDAFQQAIAYAEKLSDQAYEKERMRLRMRGAGYAPSRESYKFQVVGCSLWK